MKLNQGASGPVTICAIETDTRGSARTALTQKRRLIMRNSVSSSGAASSDKVRGSSAMPQIGHAPGLSLTTSGSIGQMYSTLPGAADDIATSELLVFACEAVACVASRFVGSPAVDDGPEGTALPPS